MTPEQRHMGKVASLDCIACGKFGVQVHHIRVDRIKNDFLTIPLCPGCHLGDFSIHKSKRQFEAVYGSELDMLAETLKKIEVEIL